MDAGATWGPRGALLVAWDPWLLLYVRPGSPLEMWQRT